MLTTTAASLAMFHPNLRGSFYKKADAAPEQQELVEKDRDLQTALRLLKIKHIDWDLEQTGCEFTVHSGVSDVVLTDSTIDSFRITMKEGASVIVEFRVRACPDERDAGHLFGLIGHELEVSLSPPAQKALEL